MYLNHAQSGIGIASQRVLPIPLGYQALYKA
jgi:hypothetical protein